MILLSIQNPILLLVISVPYPNPTRFLIVIYLSAYLIPQDVINLKPPKYRKQVAATGKEGPSGPSLSDDQLTERESQQHQQPTAAADKDGQSSGGEESDMPVALDDRKRKRPAQQPPLHQPPQPPEQTKPLNMSSHGLITGQVTEVSN